MKKAALAVSMSVFLLFGGAAAPVATVQAVTHVYYADHSEKYHSSKDCRTLKKSKHIYKVTEKKAKNLGLEPCKVCH